MTDFPPQRRAPAAHLHPRIVPWRHALAWYEDAMRLFKRSPAMLSVLAIVAIASGIALRAVPVAGSLLSEVVTPLFACGLVYGSAAADRGAAPRLGDALRAFRESTGAITAIVASALLAFGAEAFAAWWIADADLLPTAVQSVDLTPAGAIGVYALGMLASLPVMFVPFHVLFERVQPAAAFAASWNAFALNTVPLLVYAAASLVLAGFSVATMGVGLVLALPLWAASSYAGWKDVFGVRDAPCDG